MLALLLPAMLAAASSASAQWRDEPRSGSIFDEIRLGALAHHVEPSGTERGYAVNFELLFSRPGSAFGSDFANVAFRPRFHIGASVNVDGYTSQAYAGFTWDIPLIERWSLELTFGGSLHNGPNAAEGSAFGCPVNFRESGSLVFAMTERWRLYGTLAHMSNASLCDRNSGLTSAGVRLGYVFD